MAAKQFEYLSEIDEEFVCAICCCPFVDPVSCPSCLNSYCRQEASRLTTCPTCRADWKGASLLPASRVVTNLLSKLLVKCPNETCPTKQVARGDYDAHVLACPVPCHSGCRALVAPKDRESHSGVCPNVVVACSGKGVGCSVEVLRSQMAQHEQGCVFLSNRVVLEMVVGLKNSFEVLQREHAALQREHAALRRDHEALKAQVGPPPIGEGPRRRSVTPLHLTWADGERVSVKDGGKSLSFNQAHTTAAIGREPLPMGKDFFFQVELLTNNFGFQEAIMVGISDRPLYELGSSAIIGSTPTSWGLRIDGKKKHAQELSDFAGPLTPVQVNGFSKAFRIGVEYHAATRHLLFLDDGKELGVAYVLPQNLPALYPIASFASSGHNARFVPWEARN